MSSLASSRVVVSTAPTSARGVRARVVAPSAAPATSSTRVAAAAASSRDDFASFFPPEVTALEEPAAVAMAKRCRQVRSPTSPAAARARS